MKLAKIRLDKGYTQADVAKKAGVSITMVSRLELGNRRPSVNTAKKIAAVLGFEWQRFYDDEKETPPKKNGG